MPIIRNPFRRDHIPDENTRPMSSGSAGADEWDKTESVGTRPLSIGTNVTKSPTEYKLSEINDSGVYLPPSPTGEKKSFWSPRSTTSSASRTSSYRSAHNGNEPFNISRESFDSYRRSFDISARSPILAADVTRSRQSLDARRMRLPASEDAPPLPMSPRLPNLSAVNKPLPDKHINPIAAEPEERFEDVVLNDETVKPKKRSFFPRFGDSSETQPNLNASGDGIKTSSGYYGAHFFGRKRGQSGQGAELGNIPGSKPRSRAGSNPGKRAGEVSTEVPVDS